VLFEIVCVIIAYVIAEDNNTRVLFERVLSSGSSLEPEKSVYVYIFIILKISLYYKLLFHFANID